MSGTVLVSFDNAHGRDKCVLIVGRKLPGEVIDVINAFRGKEAEELYEKLVTRKEKK